ncbi:MAG TPA: response regulator [Moraxellaceae bacterium]|nr:response regulator [Moraxellaceae bacterium]
MDNKGLPPEGTAAGKSVDEKDKFALRVLVVDDSHAMHEIMKIKLGELASSFAMELHHVLSGEEALERAMGMVFDIIFMDVEMPGLSGLEACRRLKEAGCKARIAMLSSLVRTTDRDAGFNVGCDHYLEKPPKDQVLSAVLRVVRLRKELSLG